MTQHRPPAGSGAEAPSASSGDPSVLPGDEPGGPVAPGRVRLWPWRLVGAALLVLLYAADQLSKAWVVGTMVEGQRTDVVPGLLWWQFLRNPGAAFSLGESVTWIFTLVMAVVAVVLVVLLPRARRASWILALSVLLAGVLGNLTDRLFRLPGAGRGHVVDFIAVPHFAVFNVADSCICVSMVCIALLSVRGVPLGVPAPTQDIPGEETAPDPERKVR